MFSEKIKAIRESKGLTQEEFAQEIFVSRTAVTKWETGKSLPNIDTIKLISEKYGISIDELLHNEIESSFYKPEKSSFGDLELNKKQKMIAFIVFFVIAATIFTVISITNIYRSPSIFSEDEVNNFRESMKIVPEILDEWTEEKGYLYRGVETGLGVVSTYRQCGYEIYESKDDKELSRELYKMDFYTLNYNFTPSVQILGNDPEECLEEAFIKLEEADDLIKRISGRDIDMDLIRKMTAELLRDQSWKEDLEKHNYIGYENSVVGLDIEKVERDRDYYIPEFYGDNDYILRLKLFMNYHTETMS